MSDVPVSPDSPTLPSDGSVRPITRWGEDVMHRVQEPVTDFDDELRALVADMVATMYAADGVGLAACQIGVDRAVFVFDCPDDDGVHHRGVVCNPVDLPARGQEPQARRRRRGLPLPARGVRAAARVRTSRRVEGQDEDGAAVRYAGSGLLSRCLQHETDHCHGTVFGDRLNRRARKKLHKEHDDVADDFPAEWPVSGEGWGAGAE